MTRTRRTWTRTASTPTPRSSTPRSPDTLEYWADPSGSGPSPFRYLTALRQSPPGIKSFG